MHKRPWRRSVALFCNAGRCSNGAERGPRARRNWPPQLLLLVLGGDCFQPAQTAEEFASR